MTDTIPTREERIEAYRARLERRYQSHIAAAQRAAEQAQALHEESRRMADIIPAGQPILIGHHSEGRDRNYRARIESKARCRFELKQNGFHWSPTEGAWQRHMSNAALYLARQIVTRFYGEGVAQ